MNTERTREVVAKYFRDIEQGKLDDALSLLSDDIELDLPSNEYNQVIPYLGKHVGVDEVRDAFMVRAQTTEILDYAMRELYADGDTAFAIIYTKAAHTRTRQVFVIEDSHKLVVSNGKIVRWMVYFDPNTEVAAFNADREQRLVAAVAADDREQVARLVREGAEVNHRDPDSGLTPLMMAAGRGTPGIVHTLIEAGADIYTTDNRAGGTALHKAVQGGDLETVRVLVEAGAFVDSVAPTTGHTPLLDAFWYKWPDIVGYLTDRNAGLNLTTHYGFSMRDHFEYALGANALGTERLHAADDLVKARIGDDERKVAEHRLMAAVLEGDTERVRALLAQGAEVDARYAVVNGFNDAHTPLLVACRDGHAEIARVLLASGADVNATEPTFGAVPLHKAVYNGHTGITDILVHAPGIDLNYQGATNGYTPLHDAIWHGYEDCARILVDAGARLDLDGHDGKRPQELAAEVFGPQHDLTVALLKASDG